MTGRDPERVAAAAQRVAGARAQLRAGILDVRDGAGLEAFGDELRCRHGGVDIVFSNAYLRSVPEDRPGDVVGAYVDTNNLGTTRILRAFDPILRPGGRLLVVASTLGSLRQLPAQLHDRFDTEAMTLDDIDSTMLAWRDAVVEGHAQEEGWPDWINIPSKVGQVAATRVAARERAAAGRRDGTLVASICPGMIDTPSSRPWFDMSNAQTPKQAAVAPLQLALDEDVDERFYGELIRFGEVLSWR